jgi:outer membrane protein insertion porin family
MSSNFILAQDDAYVKGKEYIINDIKVTGIKSFNEQTVVTYTGLFIGKKVQIPGEDISKIISKLWKLELFSDINFYLTKVEGEKANIEITVIELPSLSEFKITGLKKSKSENKRLVTIAKRSSSSIIILVFFAVDLAWMKMIASQL